MNYKRIKGIRVLLVVALVAITAVVGAKALTREPAAAAAPRTGAEQTVAVFSRPTTEATETATEATEATTEPTTEATEATTEATQEATLPTEAASVWFPNEEPTEEPTTPTAPTNEVEVEVEETTEPTVPEAPEGYEPPEEGTPETGAAEPTEEPTEPTTEPTEATEPTTEAPSNPPAEDHHCDPTDGHRHVEVWSGDVLVIYCEHVTTPHYEDGGLRLYYPYSFYF